MKSFFENKGPFDLEYLITKTKYIKKNKYKNLQILNISTLDIAKDKEITFYDNSKYVEFLNKTKASCILIQEKNLHLLSNKDIQPIISEKPLLDFILISSIFYPDSNYDDNSINTGEKYNNFFKRSIVIDDTVEIGKNFKIGSNSTIKKNVKIGDNVSIGSNCVISNSIIEDNVIINDGTVIGKIGFGFKLIDGKMFFIPHIGCVKIHKSVYIGSNCTIDRGSFSNTIIGPGTMLDNQVHIAHNCKIGSNCFIAGQVGIAGSAIVGDNCLVGGQAGISGHLKIGNNVYIGGGSGVLKNIEDGERVMGYPLTSIKKFLKRRND